MTMVFGQENPWTIASCFLYPKVSFKFFDLHQLYLRAESVTWLEIILRDIYQPIAVIYIFH